ncbi:MAG: rod shape-determining protein RodA [Chitinophagaceae bacterium]|nr:rod shape-determining protein RodA [Chitinophagaceae bacterium]
MAHQPPIIKKGINWLMIWLYIALVLVGLISIFLVEYRPDMGVVSSFTGLETNYSRQLLFFSICLVMGLLIVITDSKFFAATSNLFYALGIVLLLATFVVGKTVGGSRSWIPLGFMNLQPAETCKIFVALALAKYLSLTETDFTKVQSQMIALALALTPAVFSILQNETGLALVYFAFFIPLYREGLPPAYLITGISLAVLVVAALLLSDLVFMIAIGVVAFLAIFFYWRKIKRNFGLLLLIVGLAAGSIGIQRFGVPYLFENIMAPYQVERIMSMLGKDYVPRDEAKLEAFNKVKHMQGKLKDGEKQENYNVKQSKIAIGSGGLAGKGFLKGTVTQGAFVPEQHTDFIFTAIGETFGFWGSTLVVLLYFLLLMVIINVAERQRSVFSRVYAYNVASVIFFHVVVNILMTMGLAPVIGIPLPLISYGGSSLLTFTIMLFILIRLDADRQMIIR